MKEITITIKSNSGVSTVTHKFENTESARNYLTQWLSNHGIDKFDAEVKQFTVWKRVSIRIS